jgi:hypothetical protein
LRFVEGSIIGPHFESTLQHYFQISFLNNPGQELKLFMYGSKIIEKAPNMRQAIQNGLRDAILAKNMSPKDLKKLRSSNGSSELF